MTISKVVDGGVGEKLCLANWRTGRWIVKLHGDLVSGIWTSVHDQSTGNICSYSDHTVRGLPSWVSDTNRLRSDIPTWTKSVRALCESSYVQVRCVSDKIVSIEFSGRLRGGVQSGNSESLTADERAEINKLMNDADELKCAICLDLYQDPVFASDGFLYCRECFQSFTAGLRPISPITREELLDIPLITSRDAINRVLSFVDRTIQGCVGYAPQLRTRGCLKTALSIVERGLELCKLTTSKGDSKISLLEEKINLLQLLEVRKKEAIAAKVELSKCYEEKRKFYTVLEILEKLVEDEITNSDVNVMEMLLRASFEVNAIEKSKNWIRLLAIQMIQENAFLQCEQMLKCYPTLCDHQLFEELKALIEGISNPNRHSFELLLKAFIQFQDTLNYQGLVLYFSRRLLNEKAYRDCEELLEMHRGLNNLKLLENLVEAKIGLGKYRDAANLYSFIGDRLSTVGELTLASDCYEKAAKCLALATQSSARRRGHPAQKRSQQSSSLPLRGVPLSFAFLPFSKDDWEKYYGNVGVVPDLPPNIQEILNRPCPFWRGKRIKETHLLRLKPEVVNGRVYTLDYLEELCQHPSNGGYAAKKFASSTVEYGRAIKQKHGSTPSGGAYWYFITYDVIPGTKGKSSRDHKAKIAQHPGYTVPLMIEAATGVLTEYTKTGMNLYPLGRDVHQSTYTNCQETTKLLYQNYVGCLSPGGRLFIDCAFLSVPTVGVAGVLRL